MSKIVTKLSKGKAILVADDANLIITDKKHQEPEQTANETNEGTVNSLHRSYLMVNATKTIAMYFSLRKTDVNVELRVADEEVSFAKETKFVRYIVDQHLNWKPHIDFICSKIRSAVFLIKQLKQSNVKFHCYSQHCQEVPLCEASGNLYGKLNMHSRAIRQAAQPLEGVINSDWRGYWSGRNERGRRN